MRTGRPDSSRTRAAGTEQPRLAALRVEHAVLRPELALIQCVLHVLLHAAAVRWMHPIEKPRQAHRRIVAGADQQAVPGRPVAAVARDVPFPYAGVHAFLCDVEPVVGPLEVPFEPDRMRQRLSSRWLSRQTITDTPANTVRCRMSDMPATASDPRGSKNANSADEHRQRRRDEARAQTTDHGRSQHGQRERQQDRLFLQPGIERATW